MANLPALPDLTRLARLAAACTLTTLAACSSPAYQGPPPEYEAPKAFPSASASAAPKAEAPPPAPYGSEEALAKNVDAYMAGFGAKWGDAYKPSGVLVVARDGKPVLTRTYGKADRDKGVDFTADTPLRIGSLTKQFTAACVMKLVESGKLSTKDSVRKWVKEMPDAYESVTLHNLLNQTSGVPSYTDDSKILARKSEDVPEADVLGWLAKKAPDFEPGSRFSYSNSNYYLLSVVVERATKKPFAAVLDELVLKPAGLSRTGIDLKDPVAVGYVRDGQGNLKKADVVGDSLPLGAGFLRSSAIDLVAWDRALEGDKVLGEASRKALFTPGKSCPECAGDYAYGFIVDEKSGTRVLWHNGAIDGYSAYFARAPEKGIAVVFLSNSMQFDTTGAGRAITKMALGPDPVAPVVERDVAPIDEAFAKTLAGDYVLSKEAKADLANKVPAHVLEAIEGIDVKWEGGELSSKPVGQGRFSLRRASEGPLFNSDIGVEIVPDFGDGKKPDAKAKGFTLKQGGLSVQYVRGKLPAAKPKTGGTKVASEDSEPAHPKGDKHKKDKDKKKKKDEKPKKKAAVEKKKDKKKKK